MKKRVGQKGNEEGIGQQEIMKGLNKREMKKRLGLEGNEEVMKGDVKKRRIWLKGKWK
jgi:hypothetical protein